MNESIANLEIELTPSLQQPMAKWVERFMQNEQCWAISPKVVHDHLQISAICLPFFLAYVNPSESNELDIARLRRQGRAKIVELQQQSHSHRLRKCYSRVLENLESIQIGEFHLETQVG